jgi:hypothetical protein
MKILQILIFISLTLNLNAQVLGSKFDSKNHPKAKGVWATVRYPTGWDVKEGERPNIVKKFVGDYNGMFVMLSLQILNAGGPVEKECTDMNVAEFSNAFTDKESNLIAFNAKKIRHEEKPAFIYEMQANVERAGNSFKTTSKVMTVCYKNNLVSAWCSPSTLDMKNQTMTSTANEIKRAESLCFQFFNSLVLMDKY